MGLLKNRLAMIDIPAHSAIEIPMIMYFFLLFMFMFLKYECKITDKRGKDKKKHGIISLI
jgi:hypothetical protein